MILCISYVSLYSIFVYTVQELVAGASMKVSVNEERKCEDTGLQCPCVFSFNISSENNVT